MFGMFKYNNENNIRRAVQIVNLLVLGAEAYQYLTSPRGSNFGLDVLTYGLSQMTLGHNNHFADFGGVAINLVQLGATYNSISMGEACRAGASLTIGICTLGKNLVNVGSLLFTNNSINKDEEAQPLALKAN